MSDTFDWSRIHAVALCQAILSNAGIDADIVTKEATAATKTKDGTAATRMKRYRERHRNEPQAETVMPAVTPPDHRNEGSLFMSGPERT